MASYFTDDAVCLRVTDFSETSQIAALFTRTHGLVPMIAKGAKRQSKKGQSGTMSGPLDLLARGQVVFIPAKGAAELATLAAWELTDPRNAIRGSLPAFHAAMVLAEVTIRLLHPHDPHADLYEEFNAALGLVSTPERPRALVAYAKAALVAAGYSPQFAACVVCGAGVSGEGAVRYAARAGGIVCGNCTGEGIFIQTTGRIALALARLAPPTGLVSGDRPAGDLGALRAALEILLGHVEAVVDRPLRTRGLVGGIFSGSAPA